LVLTINVITLQVNQRSQINEKTIEPSLTAQDINSIAYMPDLDRLVFMRSVFKNGSDISNSGYISNKQTKIECAFCNCTKVQNTSSFDRKSDLK